MSDVGFVRMSIAIVAVAALLGAKPAPVRWAGPGCDVNSPRAARFLEFAETLTHLDSVRVVRLGWHSAPTSVTLVTQQAKCGSIVAAHNKSLHGRYAVYRVTTAAVIVQAGNSYLLQVPPGTGVAEQVIFVYDSALKWTAVY